MIKLTITKFTGHGQPTVVVATQDHDEPQGSTRPTLRLIKGSG
jgi:hypothetical protein